MGFFENLINRIRGINRQAATQTNLVNSYIFGVILSGSYMNWKTDAHPTIFCFGSYIGRTGKVFVHGIQLHKLASLSANDLNWFLNLIRSYKAQGVVVNPRQFYFYLKTNKPYLIKKCFRTYDANMASFKIVNAGLTRIQTTYKPDDTRDGFLEMLAPIQKRIFPTINIEKLRTSVIEALNTFHI
jgi:hypothetical protein